MIYTMTVSHHELSMDERAIRNIHIIKVNESRFDQ